MFTNERLFTIQAFTITRVHCTFKFNVFFAFMLCNFSVQMLEYFLENSTFLPSKSLKNHPKKLHTYGSWEFFSSAALTAQNSPELHLRFINYFIQLSLVGSLFRTLEYILKIFKKDVEFTIMSLTSPSN